MKDANKNQETKKVLNVQNLTDEQLLEINLDEINLDEVNFNELLKKSLDNKKKKESSKGQVIEYLGTKEKPYNTMSEKEAKQYRKRCRNIRNNFILAVLRAKQNNNVAEIKRIFKDFKTFYFANYGNPNYSIASIARPNSDKATILDLKLFFKILSDLKLK